MRTDVDAHTVLRTLTDIVGIDAVTGIAVVVVAIVVHIFLLGEAF